MPDREERKRGVIFALSAYACWGLIPLYFKQVADVSPIEVLSHRIVWSALLTFLILVITRRLKAIGTVVCTPRLLGGLACSGLFVGVNWLIFIWAVSHSLVLEASLGYFINPMVSVLFGVVLLRERLRPAQWCAVGIAVTFILYAVARYGAVPWVALSLAGTFGVYGLLRKRFVVDPVTGLFTETVLLAPLAVGFFFWLSANGGNTFTHSDTRTAVTLVLAGPVTTIPLLFFAAGVRRIPLTLLGFLQYFSPTLNFILGVFVFHERFTWDRAVTFIGIWLALAVFSADSLRAGKAERRARLPEPQEAMP